MADTKTLPPLPPLPDSVNEVHPWFGGDAYYTADQMRSYARAAIAAQAQAKPVKPLFAAAVARRKWEELQANGHRMRAIAFDGGTGGAGTIDAWGVVRWVAQPATPKD